MPRRHHGLAVAGAGAAIGGTQEGLRASIIAVQRAAVLGYPNWGSDTCGYNEQLMEQEVCGRWLAFSALTPIMEVGPTRNLGFRNLPRPPAYDETLIALWRVYARLTSGCVATAIASRGKAHESGCRSSVLLFLVDPGRPERGRTGGPICGPIWSCRPSGRRASASNGLPACRVALARHPPASRSRG